ncbi:MAG: DUF2232 domain-containing protein [Pseudomonadota bacterium]
MAPADAGRWLWPALAAAVSLLLFLAPWLVPLLGVAASVAAPAPVAWQYRQAGVFAGRLSLGLAILGAWLANALFDVGGGWIYYLFYAALGLGLGECLARRLPDTWALGLAAAAAVAVLLAVTLGGALMGGQDLGLAWQAYWSQEVNGALGLYGSQPEVDATRVEEVRQVLISTGRWLYHLAPGVLAAGALLMAWANLILLRAIAARRDPQAPRQNLALWTAPEPLVWVLILAGAVMWASDGLLFWVGVNLVVILGVVYFFQGLAVMAYWLEKKNAPKLLRYGLYLLIAVEAFLAVGVALAGLFDLWFNFRRLGKESSA